MTFEILDNGISEDFFVVYAFIIESLFFFPAVTNGWMDHLVRHHQAGETGVGLVKGVDGQFFWV